MLRGGPDAAGNDRGECETECRQHQERCNVAEPGRGRIQHGVGCPRGPALLPVIYNV